MLEEAFARYQSELLGTLYYLVGNTEDARDALQETFLKCWRSGDQLNEVENLKAWIFRVALNTGRDLRKTAWRRRRRELPKDETMLAQRQPSPEASVDQEDQLARVRRAVANLRSEEQEVFLLRQNGELTYDQIAEAVGVPTGTVKTRMRLALTKLRTALQDAE
ncbi:MAG: sigma-70 family RNA polymerase sigma factor [Planctomycetia bacterium]|nr:sigma-70 family RNA polymerase sigma factor [Planctomycetia bacterium]